MFLPKRINVKRKAAWFGDGDLGSDKQPNDMSPTDAQVSHPRSAGISSAQLLVAQWVMSAPVGCTQPKMTSCARVAATRKPTLGTALPSRACCCAHAAAAAGGHGSMGSGREERVASLGMPVLSQPAWIQLQVLI